MSVVHDNSTGDVPLPATVLRLHTLDELVLDDVIKAAHCPLKQELHFAIHLRKLGVLIVSNERVAFSGILRMSYLVRERLALRFICLSVSSNIHLHV